MSGSVPCFHCGEPCEDEKIHYDGHDFCCQGCATVYGLLSESGLDDLYQDGPLGVRPSGSDTTDLDYLDDPTVQQLLLDFSDGKLARITFDLPAIHCSSCVYLLENLERLHGGVRQCQVNFPKKRANILFDSGKLSLKELVELLNRIGYRPDLDLAKTEKNGSEAATDRSLIYRLGVAGFCFGNIMLLSFPEYISGSAHVEEDMARFFSYLNLVLSLPVLFYSGVDYLRSAYKGLRIGRVNMDVPVAMGMLAIFLRSSFDILTATGPGFLDSLAGFVFFLLIGKWYQEKTYAALSFERDYRSFFPIAVKRERETGQTEPVMIRDLNVDDIVHIRNTELIPADAELLSETALIDYSFVTGEAEPVRIAKGQRIYAGGKHRGEMVRLSVLKPVSSSYLTSLWNTMEAQRSDRDNPLLLFSDRVAAVFSVAVILIAMITAAYWLYADPSKWLNATTAVLIIACPCALALSIPFTFGSMIRHFGRHGLFVRSSAAIDRLGRITDVVFDKTGTITQGEDRKVMVSGGPLERESLIAMVNLARQSLHPVSKAISRHWKDTPKADVHRLHEEVGHGISASVNGLNVELRNPSALHSSETAMFDSWAGEARRSAKVAVMVNGKLFARIDLEARYRVGLAKVISRLRKQVGIYLLSGDNASEAKALEDPKVAGFEASRMHFNMHPQDKRQWVLDHQQQGSNVLMIGDGLNDAGALRESYFGISVVEDTGQFTPASDAVLQSSSFRSIPDFVGLARKARKVVVAAFGISLAYNIIGISVAVQGILSPVVAAILMPLSSVSIVVFTTVTVALLAKKELNTERL